MKYNSYHPCKGKRKKKMMNSELKPVFIDGVTCCPHIALLASVSLGGGAYSQRLKGK